MRTEKEMYDVILSFAEDNDNIRAVLLNGSRTNPNVTKDKYQDYDIVYIVDNLEIFTDNYNWIDVFGERLMLQMPEAMRNPSNLGHFNWMMLFKDYNRLDLTLIPKDRLDIVLNDSLTKVLMDKDNILPEFDQPNDTDYVVKLPSELYYFSCCNNFWWCIQNVAKGIVRDEIPHAMLMYHQIVRSELHNMIDWYIAANNNESVSTGKMGKFYKKYLPIDLYEKYLNTYSDTNKKNIWNSIIECCDLFSELSKSVANHCHYEYIQSDEINMRKYVNELKSHIE